MKKIDTRMTPTNGAGFPASRLKPTPRANALIVDIHIYLRALAAFSASAPKFSAVQGDDMSEE
jgi:hypothetical protein